MKNDKDLKPIKLNVPGDPSSAAFFITAACLKPGSKLVVKNMLFNKKCPFLIALVQLFLKGIKKSHFNSTIIALLCILNSIN